MVRSLLGLDGEYRNRGRLRRRWPSRSATPRTPQPVPRSAAWERLDERASGRSLLAVAGLALAAACRASSTPRSFPARAAPTSPITRRARRRGDLQGSRRRRSRSTFQLDRDDTARDLRPGRQAGPLQAPARIRPEGRQHGREDLPLGRRRGQAAKSSSTTRPTQDAQALQDWFERITETERMLIDLERTVKFDKPGRQRSAAALRHSTGTQSASWRRAVPAAARPRREERQLSAHGARTRRRTGRRHSRRESRRPNEVACCRHRSAWRRSALACAPAQPPAVRRRAAGPAQRARRGGSSPVGPDPRARSAPREVSRTRRSAPTSSAPW